MNKKPEKNKSHSQDETRLSPDEILLLRCFLNGYEMGTKKSEKDEPPTEEENFSLEEFLVMAIVISFMQIIFFS